MEKIIDARGMACPLPVVNAKKASEELHPGDTLIVRVDNEIAVQNLRRFAEHKGFAALGEKGINIRMISQGPDELNILVGVDEKDYAATIRVLYDAFVK